jgi:hypothetical protein
MIPDVRRMDGTIFLAFAWNVSVGEMNVVRCFPMWSVATGIMIVMMMDLLRRNQSREKEINCQSLYKTKQKAKGKNKSHHSLLFLSLFSMS